MSCAFTQLILYWVMLLSLGRWHHVSGAIVLLKAYGNMLIQTTGEIVSSTGICTVEELLFRSWLAEEVAADLGFPHAIVISGLLFALVQR